MNFEELNWNTFLEYAANEARTPYGGARILHLGEPSALNEGGFALGIARAQEMQQETQEIAILIEKEALWGPLRHLQNIDDPLETLRKGGVLEPSSVHAIRAWTHVFDSWIHFPKEQPGKIFKQAISQLFDPHEFLRIVDCVITPSGELSEKASPKLGSLNSAIRDLKIQISSRMEQLLREYASKNVLQEKYTDVRDGRYVLPVRVSDQSKVEGRIAEASVSKQTVFIEPKEIENLQSQLRRKEAEYTEEVFRILAELSRQITPFVDFIDSSVQIVGYWDAVQAKARVAKKYGGKAIAVTQESFKLEQTVNPILFWNLPEDQIVRNSVELLLPKRMILLSGPNTGGKTVLLKTLGLAALAARTGFFYPGVGKIEVPFFHRFFIDLGDPQSIEEHVSSFSGHVLKMKKVLEGLAQASPEESSLILIDEMNSATDPEEGAALSTAFIQSVLEFPKSVMVATTHDPRLKALGMNSGLIDSKLILSASILFDESSLKPTYKIIFGSPGRSRAIETATRLGLPKAVIEKAKSFLTKEHAEFESTLEKLQFQLSTLESARNEAVALKEEALKIKKEYEEKAAKLVEESLEKARQKLKHVLELAQMEVRETVRKLQSSKSHKAIDEMRQELNEAFVQGKVRIEKSVMEAAPELAEVMPTASEELTSASGSKGSIEFKKGMWIRSPKWKNVGEIVEWDGKKAKVALGAQSGTGMGRAFVVTLFPVEMEMLSEQELKRVFGAKAGKDVHKSSHVKIKTEDVGRVPEQIDVRGQRLDEALHKVSQYLDHAFRGGLSEVTVIHGLGTGALREGIRAMLSKLSFVSRFDDAGTTGSTKVYF